MATRGTLKTLVRSLLGTSADDPQYSDAILEPLLQTAVDAVTSDLQLANPSYLSTAVTLTADAVDSWTYSLAAQAIPITDFGGWLEIRETDNEGTSLAECRREDLQEAGNGYFALTGTDEALVLERSHDDTAGLDLFFRYTQQPADLASDSATPSWIPAKYHDVIALDCLFVFGLGGEAQRPAELLNRWRDRRAQLLAHVGRRGIQPSRTRLVNTDDL